MTRTKLTARKSTGPRVKKKTLPPDSPSRSNSSASPSRSQSRPLSQKQVQMADDKWKSQKRKGKQVASGSEDEEEHNKEEEDEEEVASPSPIKQRASGSSVKTPKVVKASNGDSVGSSGRRPRDRASYDNYQQNPLSIKDEITLLRGLLKFGPNYKMICDIEFRGRDDITYMKLRNRCANMMGVNFEAIRRYTNFYVSNDPVSTQLRANIAHHARHLQKLVDLGVDTSANNRNWRKIPPPDALPADDDDDDDEVDEL